MTNNLLVLVLAVVLPHVLSDGYGHGHGGGGYGHGHGGHGITE